MSTTLIRATGSNVSPSDDAKLLQMKFNDCLFEDATITTLGADQLSVPDLYGMIQGRDFTIDAQTLSATLAESDTATGYILVQIDLTTDELISLITELDPYTPTYDDINASGTVAEMVIATYEADTTQVTSVTMCYPSPEEESTASGGSLIVVTANDSDLAGETVTISKGGTDLVSGTMSDDLTCELSTTEIGTLTITCGTESTTLTVHVYSKYTVIVDTWRYGFRILKATSDPDSRVEYLADNADFTTPAAMSYSLGTFDYGDWEDAPFMPKPCMLNFDGTVDYYLDPDNYAYKEDGATASEVSDTSYQGNAMMEWDKLWYYIYDDGTYIYFYVSNKQYNNNYVCYSNIDSAGNEIDHFYTPIYNGSVVSSVLRSMSGLTPMNNIAGATEITYATANNTTANVEWYTEVWSDRNLINCLLILMAKSTDLQTAFGNGHYSGGSSASDLLSTGTMNSRGLFYGTNSTGSGVKVFGMEHWWGNQWRRTAGLMANTSLQIYVKNTYDTTDGSSVTGYPTTSVTGMIATGLTMSGTSGGYISTTKGTNNGIIPYVASGSSSTYECDGLWWSSSVTGYAAVGGSSTNGLLVGPFAVNLNAAVSNATWNFGAAPSCKPMAS